MRYGLFLFSILIAFQKSKSASESAVKLLVFDNSHMTKYSCRAEIAPTFPCKECTTSAVARAEGFTGQPPTPLNRNQIEHEFQSFQKTLKICLVTNLRAQITIANQFSSFCGVLVAKFELWQFWSG
jgi:hypothetical protein